MIRGKGLFPKGALFSFVLACALVFGAPFTAVAEVPHVATDVMSDTCAMCHRAHSAPGDFGRIDPESWEMTSTALGLAVPTESGDTGLCYSCHGIDALGSGTPVGASFVETSVHTLAPVDSPFGPSVKYCSSCHDSHGADKTDEGTAYPRLLRSRTETGDRVFSGSAYCATCHTVREESSFDGIEIYEQTGHYTAMPDPASGTGVRCSNCHEPHGSAIAPLIVSEVTTPAAPVPAPVEANDRTLCFACHPEPLGVYPGAELYELSAHASSEATVAIVGEWAEEDASRLVGECQVCHAPMGRDDGTGAPIPDLLEVAGSALCEQCHDADGPAATDLAALAYPAEAAEHVELVAAFSPETTTSAFGTVAVWGSDPDEAAPRPIIGPRFYTDGGPVGPVAVGDIDEDGLADVLVTDTEASEITVLREDPLKGLSSYYAEPVVINAVADYVVVADVLADGRNDICVVSGDTLYVYWYDAIYGDPSLIGTVAGLGTGITGLAAGDLTGDGLPELVITDAGAPQIHVISGATGALVKTSFAAKAGVRGPSIGDASAGGGAEIVVANAEEPDDQVTVYTQTGAEVLSVSISAETTAAQAWDTRVERVLPGIGAGRKQVIVAIDGGAGLSSVNVFPQASGGGLLAPLRYDTGIGYSTGSLAAGDVDGDGTLDLLVGNGGFWSRDGALATAPSVQVFRQNAGGTAFDAALTETLHIGGVERAGTAPYLAVGDLGGVGPSRHPVGAIEDAHVSDEAAPFVRHVECADCHNSHEATSTVGVAPAAYGLILGTYGTAVTNSGPGDAVTYGDAQPVSYEYELCLTCHSAYQDAAGLEGAADIGAQVNAENASVHAVQAAVSIPAQDDSFEAGWSGTSVLYCIDCHSVAGESPAVAGPHASSEAPILKSPYLGVLPDNADALCYDCHKYTTYYDLTSLEDTGTAASWFYDAAAGPLHGLHVRDHGFGCVACHASHGSPVNERLVRDAVTFEVTVGGGSCIGPCHPSPDGTAPGVTYTR